MNLLQVAKAEKVCQTTAYTVFVHKFLSGYWKAVDSVEVILKKDRCIYLRLPSTRPEPPR